jgi:protein-S-isoprenylcysteine O-methyltransferase Ste14
MQTAVRGRNRIDVLDVLSRVGLASLLLLMAIAHFKEWRETGRVSGLGLVLEETVIVLLLVTRRRARQTSNSPLSWLATMVGGFGLTLARPTEEALFGAGWLFGGIELLGSLGAIFSLLVLGRSFGLVAANRGVREGGPYRWVRHPVYACYLLTSTAYLLENPSSWNLIVYLAVLVCQVVRIHTEEALLGQDPTYQAYQRRVRYRMVPFIY